jgi:hypothetical protein
MTDPTNKAPRIRKPLAPLKPNDLLPFNIDLRYPLRHASVYLHQSDSTTLKQIKDGTLESIKVGARTYVTGRSIAANCKPAKPSSAPIRERNAEAAQAAA